MVWVRRDGFPAFTDALARVFAGGGHEGATPEPPESSDPKLLIDSGSMEVEVEPGSMSYDEDEDASDVDSLNTDELSDNLPNEDEMVDVAAAVMDSRKSVYLSIGATKFLEEVEEAQARDDESRYLGVRLSRVRQYLSDGHLDNDDKVTAERIKRIAERFVLHEGIIFYRGRPGLKLFVPRAKTRELASTKSESPWMRSWILCKYHDLTAMCHRGGARLAEAVLRFHWWPTVLSDCARYARTCTRCQIDKVTLRHKVGELGSTVSRSSRPNELLIVDYAGPITCTGQGVEDPKYILLVIDAFTRWLHLEAVHSDDATTTAQVLWRTHICVHGPPAVLHSDRGAHFTADIIKELCRFASMTHTVGSVRNPRVQGIVERSVREVKTALRVTSERLRQEGRGWWEQLPAIAMVHNTATPTYAGSVGDLSPYHLTYGRSTPDLFAGENPPEGGCDNIGAYADKLRRSLEAAHAIWDTVRQLEISKRQDEFRLNSTNDDLQVGDYVLRVLSKDIPGGQKPEVRGPYVVAGRAGTNHYTVDGMDEPIPAHQLKLISLDEGLRLGLAGEISDPRYRRLGVVNHWKKLLKTPMEQLLHKDLVLYEVPDDQNDHNYFYDVAEVLDNMPTTRELKVRLWMVDALGRIALGDGAKVPRTGSWLLGMIESSRINWC
ncbi:retrovirus polyprotein, putative [Perkinsus marinus ATCC 50983]|uniref:Retrovirus polyprotein, putative n=1 Tax=Perkinsus marinus (strain ATCC 50983 / TXsc) TaxID=423536 RepID=C5K8E0_PERM5|nr:retrovirus polyprotein, putative [Perkinsus marinus ATCC 50983]EER19251.1 retrovirus polyprotein, putative [Perkinsus marinus ATCC 50983]|eukprot:XP_002787455.1 retrovirus polyprotein, putative [Perkinsus marinus ATCC 50983]